MSNIIPIAPIAVDKSIGDHLRTAGSLVGQALAQNLTGASSALVATAVEKALKELLSAAVLIAEEKKAQERAALQSSSLRCEMCDATGRNLHDAQSFDCPACNGKGFIRKP